MRLMA
jgi:hypothetical protein